MNDDEQDAEASIKYLFIIILSVVHWMSDSDWSEMWMSLFPLSLYRYNNEAQHRWSPEEEYE